MFHLVLLIFYLTRVRSQKFDLVSTKHKVSLDGGVTGRKRGDAVKAWRLEVLVV